MLPEIRSARVALSGVYPPSLRPSAVQEVSFLLLERGIQNGIRDRKRRTRRNTVKDSRRPGNFVDPLFPEGDDEWKDGVKEGVSSVRVCVRRGSLVRAGQRRALPRRRRRLNRKREKTTRIRRGRNDGASGVRYRDSISYSSADRRLVVTSIRDRRVVPHTYSR